MTEPVVKVDRLARVFDVSPPLFNRVIQGLPKQFLTAVDDVSFTIGRGETFALVGESGSGKSTVARMVVGLGSPTAGTVEIMGVDLAAIDRTTERRIRSRLQMVFQDPYASLNPRWRVDRIVAEPIRTFGILADDKAIAERVAELLQLVGLDPRDGYRFPHEFSGGQRQRIAIARALANNPELIICDEPTSALDVSVQAQILNLMRDLQDRLGLTYLFISHNLAVVRHMATRVGVMYLGRLVEVGPARDLFTNPKHPYTRMLLDAVPDLDGRVLDRRPVVGEVPNPIDPPKGCAFHPRCPAANDRCRAERPSAITIGMTAIACHAIEEGRLETAGTPQAEPQSA